MENKTVGFIGGKFLPLHLGHVYATTMVGSQCWLAEDYKRLTYAAGGSIPQWPINTNGLGFNNRYACTGTDNNCTDGLSDLFYQRYAAQPTGGVLISDPTVVRGICPSGWHLPSNTEIDTFKTTVAGSGCYPSTWGLVNGQCLNDYYNFGITWRGIRRSDDGTLVFNTCYLAMYTANWQNPGKYPYNDPVIFYIFRFGSGCGNGAGADNSYGRSVRCIKDVGGGGAGKD